MTLKALYLRNIFLQPKLFLPISLSESEFQQKQNGLVLLTAVPK